jgi:tetratricopeptide (TPR) repeat protein
VRRILLLALLVLAAAPAAAQRVNEAPRRPRLTAGADSNDARAYMDAGSRLIVDQPRQAADAFYWAYQLDPTSADALYGRYAALLLSNQQRLVDYSEANWRVVTSREVRAVDSLYFRALTMNPFLYRQYQSHLFQSYIRVIARRAYTEAYGASGVPETVIQGEINGLLQHGPAIWRAEEAYGLGRFPDAARYYQEAIRDARRGRSRVRADRARLLAHMGDNAGAMADFAASIQDMRTEDERELVFLYQSKALLEHSVGTLHERMGNRDAAREAYGRALTEDLAFYPAHVRLGLMALAAGDTATALAELDLASQAAAAEPHVMYTYAAVLAQTGRLDDAARQAERAMQAAPHWADPWFVMGAVRDGQGNLAGARQAYEGFLSRAPRAHRRRAAAEGRVRDLQAAGSDAPAQPSGR